MVERSQRKKIIEVGLFLLKVNLLLIPFYAIIYFNVSSYPLQTLFANLIASILKLLGYPVTTSGFLLFVGEENLQIDMSIDCIGWKSVYSLLALVIATPGKAKDKLRFLSIWIPVLLVVNIFRVVSILIIGLNFGLNYLEIVHTFFWQVMMIFIVLIVWAYWLKKRHGG